MPLILRCPGCQARYQARDDLAGTTATCGNCGTLFRIPDVPPPTHFQQQQYQQQRFPQPVVPPAQDSHWQTAAAHGGQPRGRKRDIPWIAIVLGAGGLGLLLIFVAICAGFIGVVNRFAEVAEGTPYSSGSGFVIDSSGYLLTNHHVVEGPGDLMVRLPDDEQIVPASVVARDASRDVALVKMVLPAGTRLPALSLAADGIGRGGEVAAFGFPLGDALGTHLKLTTGVVSALPDALNENMLVLDCTINPGNSGGPLCDARGQVVGMVTAKSVTSYGVDSYGMAIPASDLQQFLNRHLPGYSNYRQQRALNASRNWEHVDQSVSPAILMILKM